MLQGIFSLFNSNANKQIKISTILINDFIENNCTSENNNFINKNKSKESSIQIICLDIGKIEYLLNGMIESDKKFQKTITKIRAKTEILQGILYIKHFVEIKQTNRKEFNNICYYSYSKEEKIKLPKNIISIKIELFEGDVQKNKKNNFTLIAEKYIML